MNCVTREISERIELPCQLVERYWVQQSKPNWLEGALARKDACILKPLGIGRSRQCTGAVLC